MTNDLNQNRGEVIEGTRLTVYNLLPYFLDPSVTEIQICKMYELTPEQVARARAYALNNPDIVLARHLHIEERMAAGNPPDVIEQAKKTHATFQSFKEWLLWRNQAEAEEIAAEQASENGQSGSIRVPSFREWVAESELANKVS